MLEEFLSKHEGKTLEFKENTNNLKGILKSIVAFANTAGGTILVGVKNHSKEIIGVSNPLLEEEKLANAISDSIAPLMIPAIEVTSYRNKELLGVQVPHLAGPCFFKREGEENGVYVRFGSTNRKADRETIKALRLFASNKSFDELPSIKGLINEEYMKKMFKNINKSPTKKQYQMLGIYSDHFGKMMPSIGGLLLFSNERVDILPDSIVRCGYFQGDSKEKMIDQLDIVSPLPSTIEEIIAFIEKNTRKEAFIGKIRRLDLPQYPPEAVRELVVNALVHADYPLRGTHIQIALFPNRIEITNPGGLPFGQTMEKALSGYSRLRNHVIGRVFRELQYIEQWGSGLQRIQGICKKIGLKSPVFQEQDNHFRATLYSLKETKTLHSKYEQQLINYLSKRGTIQTKRAAKLWKLSDRAARMRLSKMAQIGMIIRISTAEKDPLAVYVLRKGHEV